MLPLTWGLVPLLSAPRSRTSRLKGYSAVSLTFLVSSIHIDNSSSAIEHHDANGALNQAELERLPCSCTFREYEPLEEYRANCPYVLLVCKGPHTHPIPLPSKTPEYVRLQVVSLLLKLNEDLPDMTPRRFLRHPITKAFLRETFVGTSDPTLGDLHISLSNRSHLKHYIDQVKAKQYPFGTGWEGVYHFGIPVISLSSVNRYTPSPRPTAG